jgi:methionine-rich copper-binding protein CopC
MKRNNKQRNNKHRKAGFIIFIVVAMLLMPAAVSALGITPAKRIFDFKPGKTVTYAMDIVNNGHEDLEVIIYPRGEFTENIRLEHQMITLSKDEGSKRVNMAFIMPDNIEKAGPHTMEVVAVGSAPSPENEGSIVKADVAVISKLVIEVPYPDKYAEARVYVLDTEVGKPAKISIPIFNKGSVTINEAYVKVEVYSSDGTKIEEIETEKVMLKAGANTKLSVQTTEGLAKGEYKAVATIYYDEKQVTTETMFSVGELTIDIKSLVVDKFTLGDVARFDILLYNEWSTELKGVYAEMQITDKDNNVYTDFKTVATDIPARQIGRLEGYWHTENVMPGIYYARITLYYANKAEQKLFELEVQPNKIIAREAFTGQAISASEEMELGNSTYLIFLVLAMAAVIGVLVYKLKKRGKRGQDSARNAETAAPQSQTVEEKESQKPQDLDGDGENNG